MSMFSTIKQALKNKKASNGNEVFKNFMKFEPGKPGTNGNEYVIRFLPFIKDPQYTFFEYISYNWNSLSTGKWINEISPVTFGERCPIAEEKTKVFNDKSSSQEDLDKARLLKRTKQWLANIYVINDPINPQNNGTVKILRMGKQLYDKVYNALDEENSESIGDAIFLNPNNSEGYNFRIICEQGPKFPTYARSDFSRNKTSIPELQNIDKIKEVLDHAYDLKSVFTVKSYDELKQILNEHYFVNNISSQHDNELFSSKLIEGNSNKINEEIIETTNKTIVEKQPTETINEIDDDFINSILK